jgi:hypothetical protein
MTTTVQSYSLTKIVDPETNKRHDSEQMVLFNHCEIPFESATEFRVDTVGYDSTTSVFLDSPSETNPPLPTR